MKYLGFGYDGLVRKWSDESEVDLKKGLVLFHQGNIEEINVSMTFRELSRYGMESDCTWTASSENTMIVRIAGRANPYIFCFERKEDRDEVYQYFTSWL